MGEAGIKWKTTAPLHLCIWGGGQGGRQHHLGMWMQNLAGGGGKCWEREKEMVRSNSAFGWFFPVKMRMVLRKISLKKPQTIKAEPWPTAQKWYSEWCRWCGRTHQIYAKGDKEKTNLQSSWKLALNDSDMFWHRSLTTMAVTQTKINDVKH